MGAVSGLNDIKSNEVAPLLIKALSYLDGHNRILAVEALLRTPDRATVLLNARRQEAVSSDSLTEEQWKTAENVAQDVK
jgi:HEAT repeat protein